MKKSVLYPLFTALLSMFVLDTCGQRAQDWIVLGDDAMHAGDPYGALRYYGEAMKLDSTRALHNYKYAEALRMNQLYPKAAYYYYKVYRRDMDKSYPDGGAKLAEMYKQSGNYTDAKNTWRRVRDKHKSEPESYWYRKAVQEMRSCDLAETWGKDEPTTKVKPAPEQINTVASEFSGVISREGDLLYATLRGSFDEKGRLTDNPETYVVHTMKADSLFNNSADVEIIGLDGVLTGIALNREESKRAMVIQHSNGMNEVYLQDLNAGSLPIKVLPFAGDSAWYSHPSFGWIDGKEVLFISSDRDGGYGGRDIWMLALNNLGAEPKNVGEPVNSSGDEITPFYRFDEQRLYFSSNWHYGFGGFDIFYSNLNGKVFDFPENLRKPFNTPSNDLYYSYNDFRKRGTLSSNRIQSVRSENEGCCNDIYYFDEFPDQEEKADLILTLEDLNKYLPVKLYFHNDEPDPKTVNPSTKLTYTDAYRSYTSMLSEYEEAYREGLDEASGEAAEEAMDRFFIDEVDKGINDLELFTSLLLGELEDGARIALTVKGFASPLARTDYNMKLTSRRISSLKNYLRQYHRGALLPYFDGSAPNGGLLTITEIPFGEYKSDGFVSDNPNDRSNAIYSISAARERKIEITSVQRALSDHSHADVRFTTEIADLGTVEVGSSNKFSFTFEVFDDVDFVADSMAFDSVRLEISALEKTYSIGKTHTLSGELKAENKPGKYAATILLYGNIAGTRRELTITYEIE